MSLPEQRGHHRDIDDGSDESRVWGITGAVVGFIMVLLLIWIGVALTNINDETTKLNQRVEDCTKVDGDCYQSNRDQLKAEQAMAARVNVVSAWCLRNSAANASPADISNCVTRELEKFADPPVVP